MNSVFVKISEAFAANNRQTWNVYFLLVIPVFPTQICMCVQGRGGVITDEETEAH